jgi:hypothetical protein
VRTACVASAGISAVLGAITLAPVVVPVRDPGPSLTENIVLAGTIVVFFFVPFGVGLCFAITGGNYLVEGRWRTARKDGDGENKAGQQE